MKLFIKFNRQKTIIVISAISLMSLGFFQNCAKGYTSASMSTNGTFTQSSVAGDSGKADPNKVLILVSSDKAAVSQFSEQNFTLFVDPTVNSGITAYRYKLDMGSYNNCATSFNIKSLSEGVHTLYVDGLDPSARILGQGVFRFTIDRTGPLFSFNQTPGDIIGSATAQFLFSSADALSKTKEILCSLDNQTPVLVQSPYTTPALLEGDHSFSCQSSDEAGNLSNILKKTWKVSLNYPVIKLDSNLPAFSSASNKVLFTTVTNTGSALEISCSLDGSAFVGCLSGYNTTGLAAGPHSVTVKVRDSLNRQTTSIYSWYVDLTSPKVTIEKPVLSSTNLKSYPVNFSANDGTGSGLSSCECAVAPSGFSTCTSPFQWLSNQDGLKKVSIQCKDNVGNVSAAEQLDMSFDQTPPLVDYSTAVKSVSQYSSAVFNMLGSDALSMPIRLQYKVDNATYADTAGVISLNNIPDGTHTIYFKSIDAVGNESAQKTFTWTIDTAPPTTPTQIGYSKNSWGQFSIAWSNANDVGVGVDFYEIKIGSSPNSDDLLPATRVTQNPVDLPSSANTWDAATSSNKLEKRVSYISVRATDKLGQVGPWGFSGPTSPYLTDDIYGYDLTVASAGQGKLVSKLNTSDSNLSLGLTEYEEYFLTSESAKAKVASKVFGYNLNDLVSKSPGVITSTCEVDSVVSACDAGNSLDLSSFALEFPKKIKIIVYYNGAEFFKIEKTILRSKKIFATFANQAPVSPSLFVNADATATTDVFNNVTQMWIDKSLNLNVQYICWNPPAGTQVRINVGSDAFFHVNTINPFQSCNVKAYVDSRAVFIAEDGVIDELNLAAGSNIYLHRGWGAVNVKKINYLKAQLPAMSTCPNSILGGCPADLKSVK
jgi:hypothetical protein